MTLSGTGPDGVRAHSERLFLATLQRDGALASSEIARRTGMSAQTASVVARALEADGLVRKGEPVRGKVGKPITPLTLDPDGAYALGLRVGRRRAELVLTDFEGTIRDQIETRYGYPTPERVLSFLSRALATMRAGLTPRQNARIAGFGVAIPFQIWNWLDHVNAPSEEMNAWRNVDLDLEVNRLTGLPVYRGNDATLACAAELMFGVGGDFLDFGYFFIGSFAGGGIVLDGRMIEGRSGNAGAFGTLPVGGMRPGGQLLQRASLYLLEQSIESAGLDPAAVWTNDENWQGFEGLLDAWLDTSAEGLAVAAVSVASVVEIETVVVDGAMPRSVLADLTRRVGDAMDRIDTQGIVPPGVHRGSLGRPAGARGAAYQPIIARYLVS